MAAQLHGDVSRSILEAPVPHTGATLARRELAPDFDERLRCGEDVEWWLRLAARCRVATVPEVGLVRDLHQAPRFGKGARDRLDARLQILEMHADYFEDNPVPPPFSGSGSRTTRS